MTPIILSIIVSATISNYTLGQSGVMFSHANHVTERSIDCQTCHDMAASTSSSQKDIPGHDVCSSCHSIENAPDDCRLCHSNADNPTGVTWPKQELKFSHKAHLGDDLSNGICLACHTNVAETKGPLTTANFPTMQNCFRCHNDDKASAECSTCHSRPKEMRALIHPADYKHVHKFDANAKERKACLPCHEAETFCSNCHADDNLTGFTHDLNYRFNHALDARGKEFQCESCHDIETFCEPCHTQEGSFPLDHTSLNWSPRTNPSTHANAARKDISRCATCHDVPQPLCAQPGCHRDIDGILGTNPSIHASDITDLGHGPWHNDPGFQCFTCHLDTHQAGRGFCGYCHGEQ
jgi:hypothetical protein